MIPLLNNELSMLLDDSCYFKLEVNINDSNELDFVMIDSDTRVVKPLNSGSGYERTIASLALRAVLTKVSALPKPNIVVMDEVFGKIADENLEMVGEFFKKIKEYFETGKMIAVENALKDKTFSLKRNLSNLYGVGPVKIIDIMKKVNSFEELKANPEILNDKQKIGLKYYDDMLQRIPMSEGKKHYSIINKIFNKTYSNIEFELVGSYRRKNSDMGDIDILIKNRPDLELKNLINELKSSNYIIETLANGKNKFMGLCKIAPELPARRIDILIADPSYYYFALLYFTGSYQFNIYMRRIALQKKLSLTEYGFKDKNKKIIDTTADIKTEKDIFEYLEIPYVLPENRNIKL